MLCETGNDVGQGSRLITWVDDVCILECTTVLVTIGTSTSMILIIIRLACSCFLRQFFINLIPGRGSVVKLTLLWPERESESGLMEGIGRISFVFLSHVQKGTSIVPITTATVESTYTGKSPLLTADTGKLGHMTQHHHTSLPVIF